MARTPDGGPWLGPVTAVLVLALGSWTLRRATPAPGVPPPPAPEPLFTDALELDLGTVKPCLAGPKRPQDRIELTGVKADFEKSLTDFLAKQAGWSKTRPRLFHFRTAVGEEVDIVLEDARGRCVGIEVKAGAPGNAKGLKALKEAAGKKFLRGVILHPGRETVPFAKDIHAVPVESLWAGHG